jgi:tripartite-type tricarboxylate transporter receptor subunit TctC
MRFAPRFLLAALLSLQLGLAAAQDFPSRTVRIIVPYPPGGLSDLIARPIAQKLTEAWGQSVIVENRSGASGMIGTEVVAKSPPDGYNLLVGTISEAAVNLLLFKQMPYDPLTDLQPITQVAYTPLVLMVHPSMPAKSVQDLVAMARANPGTISYASIGRGTPHHFAGELMSSMLKLKMVHVPYKGGGPALADMVGGHVRVGFVSLTSAMSNVKQGKLNALAVTSMQRSEALPDVPTMNEAGLPGFDITQWLGIFVAAKTPPEIANKLNRDIVAAVRATDFRNRMADLGTTTVGGTPQELARLQAAEIEKYRAIAASAGIAPE